MKYRPLTSILILLVSSCYYDDIPRILVCTGTDMVVSTQAQNTSGCGNNDGSIIATATGGSGSYKFSINGGAKQSSGTFQGLSGGAYLIIAFDGSACSDSTEVIISNAGSNFNTSVASVSPDTGCTTDNGSVNLTSSGAAGTVTYKIGTTSNTTGIFSGLKSGTYSATASDANCTLTISVTIPADISTSYANDVAPILENKCNYSDCHGDGNPKKLTPFTSYQNVFNKSSTIKSKIVSGAMPKAPKQDLTTNELNLIVCWIDAGSKNN